MAHVKLHLLFVCGRNKWRSPTAARLYRHDPRVEVRSAGVSASSRHQLSREDLEWADLVLVMEPGQAARIRSEHRGGGALPPLVSLDVPDDYQYMDDELVALLEAAVEPHLPAPDDVADEVDGSLPGAPARR